MWNDFNIKKPPYLTLPSTKSTFVLDLHAIIEEYFREIDPYNEDFNKSAALLSRLMAKRKNSFRHMRSFRWISKTNSALCRLLRLDFKTDLSDFHNSLPDVAYKDGTKIYLPARNCFDYLLLRLLALNKLYERIEVCCLETGKCLLSQMRMGMFFETNTLLLAVVAKTQSLVTIYNNISINLYNKLYTFREKLPENSKSKCSNTDQYQLPEKLNSHIHGNEKNLAKVSTTTHNTKGILLGSSKRFKKTDIGCVVERHVQKEERSININNLKSVADVKDFILHENNERSKNIKNCITKNIQQHEWLGVTRLFEKKIRNNNTKVGLNIFLKFIKSKIV